MSTRVNDAIIKRMSHKGLKLAGAGQTICNIDAQTLKESLKTHPRGFVVKGAEEQLRERLDELNIIGCRGLWQGLQELEEYGEKWYFVAKGFNVGYERHLAFFVPGTDCIEPTDEELRKFVLDQEIQGKCREHCCCSCCHCSCCRDPKIGLNHSRVKNVHGGSLFEDVFSDISAGLRRLQ